MQGLPQQTGIIQQARKERKKRGHHPPLQNLLWSRSQGLNDLKADILCLYPVPPKKVVSCRSDFSYLVYSLSPSHIPQKKQYTCLQLHLVMKVIHSWKCFGTQIFTSILIPPIVNARRKVHLWDLGPQTPNPLQAGSSP